jgi:agmatinase
MNYKLYIVSVDQGNAFLGFNVDRGRTPFTIVGVPLDVSSSFRSGCREAPTRIRTVSRSLELCSVLTGLNIERIGFEDIGDIVLPPGDVKTSLSRIEEMVEELLREGRIPILLGGEHTITLPSFKALASLSRTPCLLVFDSHADLRDEYLGSRYNHATVIRRILDETQGQVLIVGARAVSKEEVEEYKRFRGRLEIVKLWQGSDPKEVSEEMRKRVAVCEDIYISIDVDILDPSYAPGVQTPEPLGIDPLSLLKILETVVDKRVRVVDIVEVAPPYDYSDITSFLAAKIIIELAAIIYLRRGYSVEGYRCW